jgi:membrane associated rhomboid family serine protease
MAYRQPALPLREILSNRGAISFLFFWFLANFLFGAIPAPLGVTDATVAWEAHIGGFLIGLLAFRWFDPPAPPSAATSNERSRFPSGLTSRERRGGYRHRKPPCCGCGRWR